MNLHIDLNINVNNNVFYKEKAESIYEFISKKINENIKLKSCLLNLMKKSFGEKGNSYTLRLLLRDVSFKYKLGLIYCFPQYVCILFLLLYVPINCSFTHSSSFSNFRYAVSLLLVHF